MLETGPGLYVHVPFCLRRCSYCAFVSRPYRADDADRYLAALSAEQAARAEDFRPRTVYVGGGTPTCLSHAQLSRLLEILRRAGAGAAVEWTVEANPGTLDVEKATLLREAGVTRLSLGVQTFREEGLHVLRRIHDARAARAAVAISREAGFDDLSLDLIFGWPGQTLRQWRDDLRTALRLEVPHVSAYGLTLEPGRPLTLLCEAGVLAPASERRERRFFDHAGVALPAGGLARYEISNFARPRAECRHNLNYWTGGDYLGLGPGAHSHHRGERRANADDLAAWADRIRLSGDATVFRERLEEERRLRECAVIWLRLAEGIDRAAFRGRTGASLDTLFEAELPLLREGGWIEETPTHLRLAPRALPVADSILSELVG
jgi:oxygen-independent coproporphyrinogen-3 oxidase